MKRSDGSDIVTLKRCMDRGKPRLWTLLSNAPRLWRLTLSPDWSQDTQAKQNAGYSLHQLQGNKAHGTERSGVLYKRSEGWVNSHNATGASVQFRSLLSLDGKFDLQ